MREMFCTTITSLCRNRTIMMTLNTSSLLRETS
nr:MAG TPA: hypothetical protein [Caudoviricetes sp.]